MLQRLLQTEALEDRHRQLFQYRGLTTLHHVVQRTNWEVAQAVDLSVPELEHLLEKLSIRCSPKPQNALELYLERANNPTFLRTGLSDLDKALFGGIQCGLLTEIVGVSAMGKTQWALTLVVLCALEYPQKTILYVDTGHNFHAQRLYQIALSRIRQRNGDDSIESERKARELCKRVHVVHITSLPQLLRLLKSLEETVRKLETQAVVIDSFASLFMKSDQTLQQRDQLLQRVGHDLKSIADTYKNFIIVTNLASTVDDERGIYTRPSLGDVWTKCINTRIILERYVSHRVLTIATTFAPITQPFTIEDSGIIPMDHTENPSSQFSIPDELLENHLLALDGLPSVDPGCTLRSTQQSSTPASPLFDLVAESEEDE